MNLGSRETIEKCEFLQKNYTWKFRNFFRRYFDTSKKSSEKNIEIELGV